MGKTVRGGGGVIQDGSWNEGSYMLTHMPEWWGIVCRFQKYKCCVCVMFLSWENGKKLKTLFPNLQKNTTLLLPIPKNKKLPYRYHLQKDCHTPTTCKKTTLPLPLAKKTTLPLPLAKKTYPTPTTCKKNYHTPTTCKKKLPTPTTCKIKLPYPYCLHKKNYPTPTTCKKNYPTPVTCKK